jgi:pimeloyl-ACP methyl ester carboxylesterase
MDSTYVEVADGVRLHVRGWAGSSQPPYLLVHGLSSNARLWDGVAEVLAAAGHPVHAVDLRSHGESDAPSDGYDTQTAADDVAKVCAGLGLSPAVVAGQSWGGNVIVRFAAQHPERVAGVALVDGGWIDLTAQFASWSECESALRPPDVTGLRAEGLRRIIANQHPSWSAEAVDATLANLRVTPAGALERRLSIPHHMRIVRSMWDDPPWPDFARISAPVLLLPAIPVDADDAARRRAMVEKAASSLARAAITEYVGADHDLHAQYPAQLAADLLTLTAEP